MFVVSFIGFTVIAALAHFAVWQWRPWIPGVAGYTASSQTAPAVGIAPTVATTSTR